jgi:broad specificity phosphatase PhoE
MPPDSTGAEEQTFNIRNDNDNDNNLDENDDQRQYLFLIRHGDRWDYSYPEWTKLPTSRCGDSPLSPLGHQQSIQVGLFLKSYLEARRMNKDIIWMSSPFLRCLQTSDNALNAMNIDNVKILPEYSIFEWDGHDGEWHKDLPTLIERKQYFPRLDLDYKTFFVPALPGKEESEEMLVSLNVPATLYLVFVNHSSNFSFHLLLFFVILRLTEPRSIFFDRCQRAVDAFHQRYAFQPKQVFCMVSHAAGCLALAKTLAKKELQHITPAAPCSIYLLTRTSDTDTWSLDEHDASNSMNGYTGHMTDLGNATKPWSQFGDGITKFYTGPPTSRFHPDNL